MDILYLLIAVSAVLVAVIAATLLWAVRSGQFDDLEGPAWRILADDDSVMQNSKQIDPDQSSSD